MTARFTWPASVMVLVGIIALAGCSFGPSRVVHEISGPIFGTSYHIKVVLTGESSTPDDLRDDINRVLEDVDAAMSTWRDDSELSRFNRQSGSGDWFPVSDGFHEVLEESLRIGRMTDGAFDVTIGPVVNLWGFGPKGRPETIPDPRTLSATLSETGYEKLALREKPPALKSQGEQYVDLSAIAKGYAVDEVSRILREKGIAAYLVEIGGEIRVQGRKPSGDAWKLAVEQPISSARSIQQVVAMEKGSIATSGDYRNYYEVDGQRYSHTVDPQTGRPIEHSLASVSVIREKAMTADALATALSVMGEERGYAFAVERDLPAYFVYRDGESFRVRYTPEFSSYLIQ
ncbi:FAD:protein FMN transferase ApbE [Tamilnaduibacter salinus]|uniref:FAD:protein FMN transferase n=1 Tax=Tamilnaduibacter salinus TaxID=1484056 RepID=A0A2A2I8Q3_9GAMM|nr:FAD:protein FMN transferase [Tamilnaduibacter salinus]PAV27443.1 FAD:protein FMN transferase ApbE [Tamilnaduibacter salinus]